MFFGLVFAAGGAGRIGLAVLLAFILWLGAIFIAIRLVLVTPVAAAEPLGPAGIIRRSWQLTAGHFWRLLGFFILIVIVFAVLGAVVAALAGIIVTLLAGGAPQPGSVSALIVQLVTGVLQAVFVTYFAVMIARIYAQLSGNAASVAGVFE